MSFWRWQSEVGELIPRLLTLLDSDSDLVTAPFAPGWQRWVHGFS